MKPIEILLVEDNPGDVDLAREALETSKVRNALHVVGDGEAAMAFLRQQGKYADGAASRPGAAGPQPAEEGRPGGPRRNQVRRGLERIPVVILTTSKAEEDILKSYNLHANCYITKPIDLDQFIKVVQSIEDFWFTIVKLPPNGANMSERLRILVVEDNPADADFIREMLPETGPMSFQIESVSRLSEALTRLESKASISSCWTSACPTARGCKPSTSCGKRRLISR